MEFILGMEFITHNNVLIKRHNKLIKIPSKNEIIWVKTYEMFSVGGLTIHLMLGKTFEKECMGGCGMLSVMCVLDEFEPKDATNLVSPPRCVKRMLNKFLDVMPKKLLNELPLRRQINYVIEVMLGVAPFSKASYRMNHDELKKLMVQLEEFFTKGYIKLSKSPYGVVIFFVHKKDGTFKMCVDYRAFNKVMVKI
jgi:hypothetical protein